jgi:hypothetical protein
MTCGHDALLAPSAMKNVMKKADPRGARLFTGTVFAATSAARVNRRDGAAEFVSKPSHMN